MNGKSEGERSWESKRKSMEEKMGIQGEIKEDMRKSKMGNHSRSQRENPMEIQ